jgi:sulfur carrier protein
MQPNDGARLMQESSHQGETVSIWINDQPATLSGRISIDELLKQLQITHPAIAVEVNQRLVPRISFQATFLESNDRVEIVSLSGGG